MSNFAPLPWTGPLVWNNKSFTSNDEWVVQLSEQELEDIYYAVQISIKNNKPIGNLTRNDFSFNIVGERLLHLKDQILNGKGFTLLRGLPGSLWSDEELVRAYWGIGTWIGDAVSQNAKAHLLGHVIDQRATHSNATRIYQTNKAQPFHSDSCDIVGLLCLRTAKQGGESAIASSAAIHNHLLETDPESLELLYGEFVCDRYGEIPEGKLPYYRVKIFNNIDKKLVCCGMDHDIRSAQRLDEVQALTDAQLLALDNFQKAAQLHCLRMSLQRGDIQLINNHIVVHAREAFIDHDDISQRRYLIRLWLSSANGRALPEFLAERWGNIDVGSKRGGIKVPGAVPAVHLDPNL